MSRQLGMNTIGTVDPKSILAGDLQRVTEEVTLKGGTVYPEGAILGKKTANGVCELANSSASDGTQNIYGILAAEVDATAGDAVGVAYLTGEFALERMTAAPGSSNANFVIAGRQLGIYFKDINTQPNE